jgi:hypothetical protein
MRAGERPAAVQSSRSAAFEDAAPLLCSASSVSTELENAGFSLAQRLIDEQARDDLLRSTISALDASPVQHRLGGPFAARGLLWKVPSLATLLGSCGLNAFASQVLGRSAFPIDATYFDKHARANWSVQGHQDRIFPVSDNSLRKDRIRDGVAYAEPDIETLAHLVALRVHFDATDVNTGALRVVPGSHLKRHSDNREDS